MAGYLERLKMKKRLPQALQKLQKGSNTPDQGTAKTAKSPFYSKCSDRGRHISEIPPPSPAGLGAEYESLWHKAWKLADFIDGDTAPLADRKTELPELMSLRNRMAEIERQSVPAAGPDPEASPQGTWHPWKSNSVARDTNPESCPARCRRTGKCYSRAYFKGKPGKVKDCEPENCPHA